MARYFGDFHARLVSYELNHGQGIVNGLQEVFILFGDSYCHNFSPLNLNFFMKIINYYYSDAQILQDPLYSNPLESAGDGYKRLIAVSTES